MSPSLEKISRCLRLIETRPNVMKSEVYYEVAQTYFELDDINKAIEYARMHRDEMQLYFRRVNHAKICPTGPMREACLRFPSVKISFAHERLGEFESINAIKLSVDKKIDASALAAKSAILSFTQATSVNHDNHRAHAKRAWILVRYCKEEEAKADYDSAISIALRRGDEKAAEEYRAESTQGTCSPEYRGKL